LATPQQREPQQIIGKAHSRQQNHSQRTTRKARRPQVRCAPARRWPDR